MCPHIGATWQIRLNLCFLRPTQVHNPNGKLTGSAIFAQLKVECRQACRGMSFPPIIAPSHGRPFPILKLPLPMGHLDPIWYVICWAHQSPKLKQHLDQFSLFCTDNYPILYNGSPLPPLKITPSYRGCGPPSNTWFSGPTPVLNPNSISIAWLTNVTDRQTDRQTDHAIRSVTIGRIHVNSTAMWPNNH